MADTPIRLNSGPAGPKLPAAPAATALHPNFTPKGDAA